MGLRAMSNAGMARLDTWAATLLSLRTSPFRSAAAKKAIVRRRPCWSLHPLSGLAGLGVADLVLRHGLGLFPHYEPGKDCWTGSPMTPGKCCPWGIGDTWLSDSR